MPVRQQIAPSSPGSNSSSDHPTKTVLDGFRLRPIGTGANRNTLVETDSLSSYSLPKSSAEKAPIGVTQDSAATNKVIGKNKSGDPNRHHDKGDIFVCIDKGQDSVSNQELTYIQAYMKFMYWTCTCPFDPMKNEKSGPETTLCCQVLGFLQKVCFATITSLSIIQSFLQAKNSLLYKFSEGNLETFIIMSYFMLIVASKTYYVYQFLRQQLKFDRMFDSMEKLHAFKMRNSKGNKKRNSSLIYATMLGTSSMLVSLVQIIWTVGLEEWSPQKTIQFHFQKIAASILVWDLDEFTNGTVVETFVQENGSGINATKMFLGTLRMTMIFCSLLHNDALTNMMLTNAETINEEMRVLEVKINDPNGEPENISLAEFLSENGDWAHFRLLKQAINDNNDAFDSLLKYKHASNLMLFVYFVLNVFDGDFSLTNIIRLLYNIIRASCTYRIATQASNLNDVQRKWIRRLAWNSNDRAFLDKVPLMLDKIEKEPLGMGKGQFLIDESFLYRFIGLVGSVFVLQAQSRESQAE